MTASPHILLIDNYDSFTHNLLHLLAMEGAEVVVKRNDAIGIEGAEVLAPDALCISPGPGRPSDAGVSAALVEHFATRIPILGVCLGLQVINEVYGGSTIHAPSPVHGKTSDILHDGAGIFLGLPSPFRAARYHSLCVGRLGAELAITARTPEGACMALRHRALPIVGVQFHPESFMTEGGRSMIRRFVELGMML
jgi:anthranilate synthase/aminodeoxychorismate synthase-like glutamine amidotransferase